VSGGERARWYGRALMAPKPLTVLSAVPWWWGLWIRCTWPLARLGRVDTKLRALSFIHFAHWSLAGRWPRDPASAPDRGAARTLVFLTTFDGSDVQYIDAFVRVVPWRIRGLYSGTRGFPGARRSLPVERYIAEHNHAPNHFWAAHGDATVTMKAQAHLVQDGFELFREQVAGAGEERFAREWEKFLSAVRQVL
jgi:hypothetical protein